MWNGTNDPFGRNFRPFPNSGARRRGGRVPQHIPARDDRYYDPYESPLQREARRREALRTEQLRAEQLRAEQLRAEQLRREQLAREHARREELARRQELARREGLRAEAMRHERARDEALRDEALRDEALRDEALRDEALRDKAMRREQPPREVEVTTREAAPSSVREEGVDAATDSAPAVVAPSHQTSAADYVTQARQRIERAAQAELEQNRRAILRDMLVVYDDLERTLAATQQSNSAEDPQVAALLQGVAMVRDRFTEKLAQHGAHPIDSDDSAFDPARHEAIGTAPVEPERDGTIVHTIERGFTIGDELLRPARVMVGKAS